MNLKINKNTFKIDWKICVQTYFLGGKIKEINM
jgi:hypothetical protein